MYIIEYKNFEFTSYNNFFNFPPNGASITVT